MLDILRRDSSGLFLVTEEDGKEDHDHKGITCQDEPHGLPCSDSVVGEVLDDPSAGETADDGTDTIGHDDEESLCRSAYLGVYFTVHEDRSRDIEEIECHAVHDHREDEENKSVTGIADTEEPETKYPCQHTDEHHPLDAESAQEEWDGEDEEGLGDLREGEKDVGVPYGKTIGIIGLKLSRKGLPKALVI